MANAVVELPGDFHADHETAGLAGYPARDFFGPAGALVRVWFWGEIIRLSGHPCSEGGRPGGAYGRSIYVRNHTNGLTRFITHLDGVFVAVGQHVKPGSFIGTICNSAVSGKPNTSHVHMGLNRR